MDTNSETPATAPKWRPLSPRQRRVLGVLVEKAKTTPDAYPMTVNAIVAGCNQKSNRDPVMNLSPDDIEDVLVELRQLGAIAEVQQGGRVARYRHYMYDWLGVDKTELAVMAELMLRGEQTVGELRGRAARMEPIADLEALRPVLQALVDKKLVVTLTPSGRGQVVTHGLYKEREWDELRARYSGGAPLESHRLDVGESARSAMPSTASGGGASGGPGSAVARPEASAPAGDTVGTLAPAFSSANVATRDMFSELELEVAELRAEVARLRERLERLER